VSQATSKRPHQNARAEQLRRDAETRRTDRRVRASVAAAVVLLLVAVTAIALATRDEPAATSDAGATGTVAVPAGVDRYTLAVPAAPDVTPVAGAPQLYVWEDFQCPACGQAEAASGETLLEMARAGEIELFWRITTFLDDRFPGEHSQRAAAAWGCAVDAGRGAEFHQNLFATQPASEGQGWPDDRLLAVGRQSGIAGADRAAFEQCVADGTYADWASASTAEFHRTGVPGTPTAFLNGHQLEPGLVADTDALVAAIEDARAGH
jgi:protein-disulfide isomerase